MKKVIMFLILFLIFSGVCVAGETNTYLEGVKQYYQGNYQQSVDIFDELLEEENIDEEILQSILHYKTLGHIRLLETDKARNIILRLTKMGYQNGQLHWRLGQIYLNKGGHFDAANYDKALTEFNKAEKLGINNMDFRHDLAVAHKGAGNIDEAIKEYKTIINNNGKVTAYLNLGDLFKTKGNKEEAIKYYEMAADLERNNLSICLNLGDLYLTTNNFNQAAETLIRAREINPNFGAVRYKLGKTYFKLDKLNLARTEFKESVKLQKHNYQAYYYLGNIEQKQENWQQAINYYQEAVKYNPNYASAYLEMGKVYLNQDQYPEAVSRLMKALEKNSNFPPAHYYLGLTYKEMNMKEAAIGEFRKTVHLDPDYKDARNLLEDLEEE